MSRENEKEFASKLLMAYATWSTIPTESAQTFAQEATKMLEVLTKGYFPFTKTEDSKERDEKQLKMVEKLFEAYGMGDMVLSKTPEEKQNQALIEASKRESIWEKMAKGKKE